MCVSVFFLASHFTDCSFFFLLLHRMLNLSFFIFISLLLGTKQAISLCFFHSGYIFFESFLVL